MEAANVPTITSSPCIPAKAGTEVTPSPHVGSVPGSQSAVLSLSIYLLSAIAGRAKLPANDVRPFGSYTHLDVE
jgi:hypothetical protein